jgi:hypothetical protein
MGVACGRAVRSYCTGLSHKPVSASIPNAKGHIQTFSVSTNSPSGYLLILTVLINITSVYYGGYYLFDPHYLSSYIANRPFDTSDHRAYSLAADCYHDFVDNSRDRFFRIDAVNQ